MSPKEPKHLMEASLLAGAQGGKGPVECKHAPLALVFDMGLHRRKSHYTSGLIFQVLVPPTLGKEFASLFPPRAPQASSEAPPTPSQSASASYSRQATGASHRYLRYCVIEGGRYDSLILEHRSPAQWASPLLLAMGMTVSIEKLTRASSPSPSMRYLASLPAPAPPTS
ncbi:hypothetical protein NGA_0082100 [Nannochloropsis gaditana CCMP526]|uniref:uncharacterized protein n=1 Tax=Nannochloropsis gaditana (strain CCMP526) TaxID=1093141 RepID=UPI00029F6C4F|nr:hypothetical protein NGA_0082100 [Nannochloropsis gaditana CCMP526]EKU21109.1 hypothetical protein NGA_0082100 [Nannochloropsis gaditana CCMP526]|eukprot:XP_005855252.1 hypothetical protein NGA_0082100 [Nannochloropsis gaditana CCMP526]